MTEAQFENLQFRPKTPVDMVRAASDFYDMIRTRRSVRDYADQAVPREVIVDCLRAAGTAPSGANKQPWHFVVVEDPAVKREIRLAAEAEEREFYARRASEEWLEDLAPLGTDADKPFLEVAPYLIVIFARSYSFNEDGSKQQHYYVQESVGIATGVLITALHQAGLATLTHTPSPMGFLNRVLDRPKYERPFLILVTGYPKPDAQVPVLTKKPVAAFVTFV